MIQKTENVRLASMESDCTAMDICLKNPHLKKMA